MMMKYFLFAFLFFLNSELYSKNSSISVHLDTVGTFHEYQNVKISRIRNGAFRIVQYYQYNKIKFQTTLILSIGITEETIFDVEDNSSFTIQYDLGSVFHGTYTEFYQNGQVKEKGKYRNGEKIGRWRFYSNNGLLVKIEVWPKDLNTPPRIINK